MKLFIIASVTSVMVMSGVMFYNTANAEPGGCLKYGAAGGVAGHFVGKGHAVAGATAGCALGAYQRHKAHKKEHEYYKRHSQGY